MGGKPPDAQAQAMKRSRQALESESSPALQTPAQVTSRKAICPCRAHPLVYAMNTTAAPPPAKSEDHMKLSGQGQHAGGSQQTRAGLFLLSSTSIRDSHNGRLKPRVRAYLGYGPSSTTVGSQSEPIPCASVSPAPKRPLPQPQPPLTCRNIGI